MPWFFLHKKTHPPVHLGQWDIYYDTSRDLTKALLFKKCLQDHQKDKTIFPRFIIYCVISKGHFLRVILFLYTPLRKTLKRNCKSSGENLSFFVGKKPHSGWQENLVACDGAWRLQPGKRFMQNWIQTWPHSEANQSILAMVFLHWRCFFFKKDPKEFPWVL